MVFVCYLNIHVQMKPFNKKGIFSQGLKGINGVLPEINYKELIPEIKKKWKCITKQFIFCRLNMITSTGNPY